MCECSLVCMLICLGPHVSHNCLKNSSLTLNGTDLIDINTTTAFCFILPIIPISTCSLNYAIVIDSPPDVIFLENKHTVVINNWTAVNLANGEFNRFHCDLGIPSVQERYFANFYSLSKFF